MTSTIGHKTECECDLRYRAWNPNTGRCETCGSRFEDRRIFTASSRPAGRRAAWEIVVSYVEQFQHDNTHVALGIREEVVVLVLADMRKRDAVDRQRHGTPLTAGNGRDHLMDAYQKMLDACVNLMTELDEHGIGLTTKLTDAVADRLHRWYLHDVQQHCTSQLQAACQLRALIKERDGRRQTHQTEEHVS